MFVIFAPLEASKLVSDDLHIDLLKDGEENLKLTLATPAHLIPGWVNHPLGGECPGRILTRILSYFYYIKTLTISTRPGDKYGGYLSRLIPARDLKLCRAGQICQPHLAAGTLVVDSDFPLPVFCLAASGWLGAA